MSDLVGDQQLTLRSVLSINDDEQKYNVLLDGQKFAELTLGPSGETSEHNFAKWTLKRLETLAFGANEYTITAPADSVVVVNGQTLTEDDAIETGIATAANGNLPDGVPEPTLTKYGVYMSFGAPERIEVTDRNGNPQELIQDSERSWSCGIAYDDSIKSKVESSVVTIGRRIAAFTSEDYSKYDLIAACINPSPARSYILNMDNQWTSAHDSYKFNNIETYDYYVYSDNCFSCKISFDYVIHYTQGNKTYPTNYTLYFAKSGKTFKLYSFTTN